MNLKKLTYTKHTPYAYYMLYMTEPKVAVPEFVLDKSTVIIIINGHGKEV